MIRYALACADGHEFEAWFRNSDDDDVQTDRGLVECPPCGWGALMERAFDIAAIIGPGPSHHPHGTLLSNRRGERACRG